MTRQTGIKGLLTCCMLATFILASAPDARADKWQLSILWPAGNFSTQGVMEFADLVSERTGGRLVIEVHAGGSLGYKGPDMLQVVKDGLVPVGEMLLGYVAGTEPVMDFSTMPFLVADYGEAHILGTVARPHIEKVFEKWNQKLLYWQYWSGAGLYTNKPINSLEDLKGLKLRTFNNVSTQWAKSAGAKPVSLPWGDVYMAMSTGSIDALLTSSVSGADGKFWEVMDHFTDLGFTFGYSAVTVNMNVWKALPADIRLAVLETAREMEARQEVRSIQADRNSVSKLVENGMTVSQITPEFRQACAALAEPIWEEWIKKSGPAGGEIIDEFRLLTGK
jgi:TRAP-type transport system periplasmic protein